MKQLSKNCDIPHWRDTTKSNSSTISDTLILMCGNMPCQIIGAHFIRKRYTFVPEAYECNDFKNYISKPSIKHGHGDTPLNDLIAALQFLHTFKD